MRDALKAKLEEEADANQRSVSEEIEYQLEGMALLRHCQGVQTYSGQFAIRRRHYTMEEKTGKAWDQDEETAEKVLVMPPSY